MKVFNQYIKLSTVIILSATFLLTGCSAVKQVTPQYDVGLKAESKSLSYESGREKADLTVKIYNKTFDEINSDNNIFLSYHILDTSGNIIEADGLRSEIAPIPARGRNEQTMEFLVPKEKGQYILQLDLVEEGVTWFSDKGNPVEEITLNVGE